MTKTQQRIEKLPDVEAVAKVLEHEGAKTQQRIEKSEPGLLDSDPLQPFYPKLNRELKNSAALILLYDELDAYTITKTQQRIEKRRATET